MHLSMCCPTNPPPPTIGLKWGFDTKILSHHGEFDISEHCPTIWGIDNSFKKVFLASNPHPSPHIAPGGFDTLDLPHYEAFDILVCQIPTIVPYKGGGAIH